MAVLKILVSAALLGTMAKCQDYYSAYSPGGNSALSGVGQYAPSALSRGTPRLVPVKVRPSASRFFPSYFYPGPPYPPPPPPPPHFHHQHSPSQMQAHSSSYPSHRHSAPPPTFPRLHQQYRTAMTGYYRPTRQSSSSYFNHPYHETGQPAYHTAATAAPVVLKRGRVLPAPSPYSLEAGPLTSSSSAASYGSGLQYTQSIPAVSAYRPAPQPQISASPVHHQQLQLQQPQQPAYYIQKGPVVVGPSRPVKVARAKKPLPPQVADAADAEEEYPGDPNPQYNFSFDIKDDELTNYQNRQEERDGQTIKGSYSVVDPDGYVRTVTYTADPKNGFQAKVTREPTDVKIKFPVPTEAPAATAEHLSGSRNAGPRPRGQAYQSPQAQYQPQYQTAAYATPQQVYAVQPQVQVQPQQYVARSSSRFAVQPQAQASSPRARLVRRVRRPSPPTTATVTEQRNTEQE